MSASIDSKVLSWASAASIFVPTSIDESFTMFLLLSVAALFLLHDHYRDKRARRR
jgi:hypothetical protein